MTLDELRSYLEQLPVSGDAEIFLSSDAEGNQYSLFEAFDLGFTDEDGARIESYFDDDADDPGNMREVVVLYPV